MILLTLASIAFPDFDPVAVHVGPLAVRWYGIAYVMGIALGYVPLLKLASQGMLRVSRDAVGDLMSWAAAGVVIGGRLGWWLIYHRGTDSEATSWYEPIAIWHGGMSFHGGLVGVIVAAAFWSRHKRVSFWNVIDHLALVTPIGLFFGRLANFINAELVGRPTTLPWGVIFPGDSFARHPSQLYEALLEGPALLALLLIMRLWTCRHDGRTSAVFLIVYGSFRFIVEFTREPDSQIGFVAFGWLTMGQLLSLSIVAAGSALLSLVHRTPSARA